MQRRTKIIVSSAVCLTVILGVVLTRGGAAETLRTEKLDAKNIERTVLATGTVTSSIDLDLAFKGSGVVQRIPVKVSQKVKVGEILAQLDSRDQAASVTQARGAAAQAKANLEKVLSGASSEEVAVAQVGVTNAEQSLKDTKAQQAVLVENARQTLLNSGIAAVPASTNISTVSVSISGTYTGGFDTQYVIRFYGSGGGQYYAADGPGGISGLVTVGVPLMISANGLYMTVSGNVNSAYDRWTVSLPNTQAANYGTNLNAYNAALQAQSSTVSAAQSQLDSANATLNLKKIQARPADVAAAQAGVLSAQGQLQAAAAQFENTIVRSPSNGTVTKIDIKVGEQATALKPVIVVQDVGSLYVEANISEANIAQVKQGQKVVYTFDALGSDREFTGTVTAIDPASTVVSGVVNYKVTASVDDVTEVKPGMTANMSVQIATLENVLAVPQRSLVEENGKKFVRVITDAQKQTYEQRPVEVGLAADGGLVEIKSGLSAGDTIVTFIETKK